MNNASSPAGSGGANNDAEALTALSDALDRLGADSIGALVEVAVLGKVAPYGICDIAANAGWINVGTDHETAAFAVQSIRRWRASAGVQGYPGARQLLITADCGGSNGNRRNPSRARHTPGSGRR